MDYPFNLWLFNINCQTVNLWLLKNKCTKGGSSLFLKNATIAYLFSSMILKRRLISSKFYYVWFTWMPINGISFSKHLNPFLWNTLLGRIYIADNSQQNHWDTVSVIWWWHIYTPMFSIMFFVVLFISMSVFILDGKAIEGECVLVLVQC